MQSLNIKKLAKAILPVELVKWIGSVRSNRLQSSFIGLTTAQVFDRIYDEGLWGRNSLGDPLSGNGSHAEEIINPYIDIVGKFLGQLKRPVVVDLGCGDFEVGKKLVSFSSKYIACDISSKIIGINIEKYSDLGVEFKCLNLSRDELPRADVALIRQVLQHLSNQEIHDFVKKINESKPYRYIILTEHLPVDNNFLPNIDKATGPGIRLDNNSGVVLNAHPFNMEYIKKIVLLDIPCGGESLIRTVVYEI